MNLTKDQLETLGQHILAEQQRRLAERAEHIAAGEIVELTICVVGDQCVEEAKARALREHLTAHPEHKGKAVIYVVNHIITGVPRRGI